MVSINDSTILAVLSRCPNMPAEEADDYIGRIEHAENVPLCHAVIGRIGENDLDDDARTTFREFNRWSEDRTHRERQQQQDARRRRRETRTALTMTRLHAEGRIPDHVLVLYGISGELPERTAYAALSREEKERLWRERMEARFGPNWERNTNLRVPPIRIREESRGNHDWSCYGF